MTGLKLLALASPLIAALGGSVVHKKLGTEANILAHQKTWRDTLLLNEEMGYFPYPIPPEHLLKMANQSLATMGVKHPIVVRMMPHDNKHARAAAYANARQGLICLNPTDFSDTNYAWQYFALLHEASHIAHYDGTLAGKTWLVAHCEKRADTDALNAIDCKQCWSSIADCSHEEPSKKGYLSRTDIIAMMNKRTAWSNTCSHHRADEDSAKRSSFMHTALTNLGKITLDLCLCAGASTLNACFLYPTTSTSTKLVALVGWQALEELLKHYSQTL